MGVQSQWNSKVRKIPRLLEIGGGCTKGALWNFRSNQNDGKWPEILSDNRFDGGPEHFQ